VRFIGLCIAVLLALALVATLPAAPAARAATPVGVTILFDLGDGSYAWANATIPDPAAPNATWEATQAAASSLGLSIRWTWFDCCGVFISDVGDRSPPAGAAGLFLWNRTARSWDLAPVGISSLVLQDGDVIALSNAAFDPVTYGVQAPTPTPDHPYPALEFRGDYANRGVSRSPAPDGLRVRWDRDLGLQEIPASPAVAHGRVYVLTLDGLFALDEASGSVLWSNPSLRGLSTPAVFNGTLLFGGTDGRMHAVDEDDGAERWNVTLVPRPAFSGITSSPKVLFHTAYVGTFNETGGPGEVVALWATNGTVRWRSSAPGSVSFSSPAIVDGVLYVGVIGRYNVTTQITYDPPYGLLALDARTGAQRWFARTNGPVAASPLVAGPYVVAAAKDGNAYALNRTDGSLVWKRDVGAGVSSPALVGDLVVVAGGAFGGSGRVTGLELSTGNPRWTVGVDGPVQSSVTYADGAVFFATNTAAGTIYALDASSGNLVWNYTPVPRQFILATPVVADGAVFAASDNGHVYAFERPEALVTWDAQAPQGLPVGETGTLTLRLVAASGRADRVSVRLNLSGLEFVSSEPAPSGVQGEVVEWDIEALPFRSNWSASVRVRPPCVALPDGACSTGTYTQGLTVTYAGFAGDPYPPVRGSLAVRVSAAPSSGGLSPTVLALSIASGTVVAVVAIAVVLVLRRRSGRAR